MSSVKWRSLCLGLNVVILATDNLMWHTLQYFVTNMDPISPNLFLWFFHWFWFNFCFCISAQINIALNRPASQSSTYRSHVASKAVDGNAVGDSCSITGGGDYQLWWKVELAIASWITHVELTNRRYSVTWRYELKYYIINSFARGRCGSDFKSIFSEHMLCSWHDDVTKWKHFRVTGHLWGEFTGPRWIPRTKASDAELSCFLWSASEQAVEKTIVRLVIWDAIAPIITSL